MNEKKKFNPWPIGVTIICIAAFAAATTVVVVMVKQNVDLVRPDYYEQDLRHETRMEQERRANSLKAPATISYDKKNAFITIDFPATNVYGTITLYRPSDLSLDQEVPIAVDANNRQTIEASGLQSGLWRVRIEWFQDELSYYQEKAVMLP